MKELNILSDSGLASSLQDTKQVCMCLCVCVCVCVCVCDLTSIPVHQAVKHEHLEMKKLFLDHEKRQ